VNVDFPADFVTKQLAGKKGCYEVEVVEVKEKSLPPIDDAFAKKYDAENLPKLAKACNGTWRTNEVFTGQAVRGQIIHALLTARILDLPETAVAHETRNVFMTSCARQPARVGRDLIEKQKDEIYSPRHRAQRNA